MTEHHTFREPGGAAGVEDTQQGIATAARVLDWLVFGDQLLVVVHAGGRFAVTRIDQGTDGLGLGDDLRAQVLEVVIDDQDGGFRVVQRIDDLRHAPAVVHRVDHRIGPRHRLVVLDVTQGVERQHGHAVTTGHPKLLQRPGQAGDTVAKLAISDTASFVTNGGRVGTPLQMTVQPLGDVHAKLQSCCY
ncbi:hypothetical protein D3C81_1538260 [compost metagenome]